MGRQRQTCIWLFDMEIPGGKVKPAIPFIKIILAVDFCVSKINIKGQNGAFFLMVSNL